MSPTAAPTRPDRRTGQPDRRAILAAALLLAGVIIGGIVLVTVFTDTGTPKDAKAAATYDDGKPRIIQRPNSGTAPAHAGDRGGWEQLGLLGLLVIVLVAIAVVIARGGGSKARATRAAWKAAAEADHDGAIDP
jgi:hypothetical protein